MAIVVPISVIILVLIILCCFLRKRAMLRHEVTQDTSGKTR